MRSQQMASQVIDNVDPLMLQRIILDKFIGGTHNTYLFESHESDGNERLAVEITTARLPSWVRRLPELTQSPTLQIYITTTCSIIVGRYYEMTLDKVLSSRDVEAPWLNQRDTANIFRNILPGLIQLKQNGIVHGNITLNSIIYEDGRWKVDLVPSLLDLFSTDRIYYPTLEKNHRNDVFALGIVLFCCLFGFFPFDSKPSNSFDFRTYMDKLDNKTPEQASRIYYFLRSRMKLTQNVKYVLEAMLSFDRNTTLEDIANYPWLQQQLRFDESQDIKANQEVKMLSTVDHKNLSKALAAIDTFRQTKSRKNIVHQDTIDQVLKDRVMHLLATDRNLSKIRTSHYYLEPQKEKKERENILSSIQKPKKHIMYFNQEIDDLEDEYPCRELDKFIKRDSGQNGQDPERVARIMMYGFPYAVAFEIQKKKQQENIKQDIEEKMNRTIELLHDVSQINYPRELVPAVEPLQPRIDIRENFEFYKAKYREYVHWAYKYFLDDAIYKYNTAKKQIGVGGMTAEAHKMRQAGLDSYRLCWKLLEASLIIRKGGHDLDIGAIETSDRKCVEINLNNLLGKYFPNRLY